MVFQESVVPDPPLGSGRLREVIKLHNRPGPKIIHMQENVTYAENCSYAGKSGKPACGGCCNAFVRAGRKGPVDTGRLHALFAEGLAYELRADDESQVTRERVCSRAIGDDESQVTRERAIKCVHGK